jgi:tetratricopeptide (TPR) repeat protein
MKRKVFFGSFFITSLLVAGGNEVFAQKKEEPAKAEAQTCEEFLAKPATAEQLKQLTDENRKLYEAEVKRCTEGVAKNEKLKNSIEIVNRTLKEGAAALDKKDYETAVAKFDEGYNADPDYWGSATVMLRNKAIALRARGVDKFNTGAKNSDKAARSAAIVDAGKDFQASVDALQKAVDVFGKSTAPADATQAKSFNDGKFTVISDRVESYRLLVKADPNKAGDAVKAYEEYLTAEPDATKKQKAQLNLAQAIFTSGDLEKAIPEYRKVLATQPGNPDALYELGAALIAIGDQNNDKPMKMEGVAMMEKLVKSAPSGFDQAKLEDAKGQIEVQTAKEPTKAATGGKRKN